MITNSRIVARTAATLAIAFLTAQPAIAEGDPEAGKEIAYSCLGCHGIEGYRNAYPSYRVPKLGGQQQTYIEIALKGYRDGTRTHGTMDGQATSLTDKEISDVAAYLASINNETVKGGGSKAPSLDKAAPCAACHGPGGISNNPMWPTLAGQHEDYLVVSLQSYRDGSRTDAVMSAQAALLEEEDIAILARYFASLEGLETTKPE